MNNQPRSQTYQVSILSFSSIPLNPRRHLGPKVSPAFQLPHLQNENREAQACALLTGDKNVQRMLIMITHSRVPACQ